MFYCQLCEKETVYISRFCPDCRSLKHLILLHGDRVHEIVNEVLCRNHAKQNTKIKQEIKKEIENKEYNLRSSPKKNIQKAE
tara:strand:+ start:610 stop:855 length:246 start_codon:yes stop_codon:yes gene_type:complete